ncbi:LPP20 family lipoprotein [Vibrio sp.]|nr:LPP20 family lipoprotein [Vibrio sp.]
MYVTFGLLMGCQPLKSMGKSELLSSVGYASISGQKGNTDEEKQIRAMRASKVDAYRELAEQVYGLRISGTMDLRDQYLGTESTSAAIDGVIRGAEVLKTYRIGDSYVTELRLDMEKMNRLNSYSNDAGRFGSDVRVVPEKRQQTLF